MALEEAAPTSISSTQAETMPRDTMIGPLEGMCCMERLLAAIFFFNTVVSHFSFLVNEIEESGENAAGSVTGRKKGIAAGQDLASVVGVHALANERGTERGMLETRAVETLAVGRGTGIVGLQQHQQEKTTGVGKGVEKERKEAEARTARGKGREERGWTEKMWLRETGRWRALSGYWRNMK